VRLLAVAPFSPLLFYCRYGSKEVIVWDLETKSRVRFGTEMKKQTTAIMFDQNQPYVVSINYND